MAQVTTSGEVAAHFKRHFVGRNLVIAATGDVDDLTTFIQILERSLLGFGERADRLAQIINSLRDRLSRNEPLTPSS